MALLRLSDGRIYTTHEDIAPHIGTVKIGTFDYPEELRRQVERLPTPLSEADADFIVSRLDPKAVSLAQAQGLVHLRIGSVTPPLEPNGLFSFAFTKTPAREMSAAQIEQYRTPHAVEAVDWHFVVRGAIIKGLQLENGLQGVIYVQPGEWIWLNPTVVNWPIFAWGQPTIGVSYFDKEIGAFGQSNHPDLNILPGMTY